MVLATLALAMMPARGRAEGRSANESGCGARHVSAIGQVSCELARGLPAGTTAISVVTSGVVSDQHAERTEELGRRLASLVAGELGARARASERILDVASAQRSTPRGVDVLVLSAELGRERFRVSADLFAAPRGFWERFRPGLVGAVAHVQAAHLPDAELLAYLPPVPLVLTRIDKAAPLEEASVAVACGDVDGDGALEIVYVGRHKIQLGRVVRGKFQVTASALWADLSGVAPRPLREPVASAAVSPSAGLEVGISDRADGLRLDRALRVVQRFPGRLPWPAGGCASVGATGLAPERTACNQAVSSRATDDLVDALAGTRVVRRDGSALSVFATRRTNGQLELERGGKKIAVATGVGAQVALGDLDGDGRPELLSTLDTLDPSRDALLVRTLGDDGTLRDAFQVAVPSGVRSLAICPSEGSALTPVVLATGDGLWVLR